MGLPRQTLNGKRPATGSWSKGRFTEGLYTAFTLRASVQPVSPGEAAQILPEGRRDSQAYLLITNTELKTVDVEGNHNPDVVTIYGDEHEIISVETWQNKVIPHYEAIAVKLQ